VPDWGTFVRIAAIILRLSAESKSIRGASLVKEEQPVANTPPDNKIVTKFEVSQFNGRQK